jgi:copper resistance protein B
MRRCLLIALLAAGPLPALAQHQGHGAQPAPADPHAGHRMPATPAPAEAPPSPSHRGHDMGATDGAERPAPPVAPPPPEARSGPVHAADGVYGEDIMRSAREGIRAEHGAMPTSRFSIDRLEIAVQGGRDGYAWEGVQFRYGGDRNRLWLKSEGEGTFGEGIERAEVQALWSRAIAPYFDVQAGIRYDIRPRPDRAHLVLGIQGLAPYWFEVDAALFLSQKGDLTARAEVEYDQRITQRLILQPRAELDFSLQDVPELGLGSGVTSGEAGLRLRYEFVPEFAPYVGVAYARAFGDTAAFRRVAGADAGGWRFVMGVRAWF